MSCRDGSFIAYRPQGAEPTEKQCTGWLTTRQTENERKKAVVVLLAFLLYTFSILFFASEETTLSGYSNSSRSGI